MKNPNCVTETVQSSLCPPTVKNLADGNGKPLRPGCRPCPAPCYFENLAIRTAAQKSSFKACESARTKKSLLAKLFIFSSVQFFQYFGATEKNTLKNALVKKSKIII